jgi:Xaa-Pro aminopeptidase
MAIDAERHRERRDRVRTLAAATLGADLLIVTHLPNVRYLTGFSGSNGVLVLGGDGGADLLGTDGRYVDQVAVEAPGLPTVIDRDTLGTVIGRIAGPGRTAAIEASLAVGDLAVVREGFGEPVLATGLVEQVRAVKDKDEIAALAQACAITVEALAILMGEVRVGVTEVTLARRIEQLFGELGAEDRAFDTIVGSGPHSAIPHHQPGARTVAEGDLLVVDCGARVDGYHADMTRTVVVGREPEPWQADLHRAVEEAQAAATDAYRAGTPARDIDGVARGLLTQAGLGERFTHGLGHGVGLEIHEAPMVGARSTGTLGADMVITVEPGAYLPGRGGVRIEDTLVVSDAAPRILTEAPRGLRVVG